MTRKEVIEFGKMWLEINEDCKDSSTYEFFQIALEALAQEDILDKIRAEIDELEVLKYSSGERIYKDEVLDIIDKYKAESEDKDDK